MDTFYDYEENKQIAVMLSYYFEMVKFFRQLNCFKISVYYSELNKITSFERTKSYSVDSVYSEYIANCRKEEILQNMECLYARYIKYHIPQRYPDDIFELYLKFNKCKNNYFNSFFAEKTKRENIYYYLNNIRGENEQDNTTQKTIYICIYLMYIFIQSLTKTCKLACFHFL